VPFLLILLAFLAAGCAPVVQQQRPSQAATVFRCPMHPDVRETAPGTCPRCGMALVAAASHPAAAEYHLEVESRPSAFRSGVPSHIRFRVREARTATVVQQYETVHERAFHLFLVSQDLEHFEHLHPELRPDGSLDLTLEFPRPGPYHFYADFLPAGGLPQLLHTAVVTADYDGTLASAERALATDMADKVVDGLRVRLESPAQVAGREQVISVFLEDAASGKPVTDLQPYLGAWGHMLILSWDLADVVHSHPIAEISDNGGPRIVFSQRFPRAGRYRLWAQFQRGGEIAVASFTLDVAEATADAQSRISVRACDVFDVCGARPVVRAYVDPR
jgi:hypothetical protein